MIGSGAKTSVQKGFDHDVQRKPAIKDNLTFHFMLATVAVIVVMSFKFL